MASPGCKGEDQTTGGTRPPTGGTGLSAQDVYRPPDSRSASSPHPFNASFTRPESVPRRLRLHRSASCIDRPGFPVSNRFPALFGLHRHNRCASWQARACRPAVSRARPRHTRRNFRSAPRRHGAPAATSRTAARALTRRGCTTGSAQPSGHPAQRRRRNRLAALPQSGTGHLRTGTHHHRQRSGTGGHPAL